MPKLIVQFAKDENFLPSVTVEFKRPTGATTVENVVKKARKLLPPGDREGALPAVIATPEGKMLWWDTHVF